MLVASWINETQAKRAAAAVSLKKPARRRRMTEEEIMSLVIEIGKIRQALHNADRADKAEVYGRLGLTLTCHPNEKRVAAEARSAQCMYVGACPRGDLNPETRAFSPILRLSTQVREKSPIRGFHAFMLAATPGPVPSGLARPRGRAACAWQPRRGCHAPG